MTDITAIFPKLPLSMVKELKEAEFKQLELFDPVKKEQFERNVKNLKARVEENESGNSARDRSN